ncbi:hypothetical protein EVAR_96784_1 [Eumeta japonica]|uniref:Uncharacterized protein n=1 Tax=Eumeta variegata TaxID=151549 RepID=A0A4C1WUR0_EUMVA|nr:hypothetical protein EVAR_96784_1 [Eumeta japonica]
MHLGPCCPFRVPYLKGYFEGNSSGKKNAAFKAPPRGGRGPALNHHPEARASACPNICSKSLKYCSPPLQQYYSIHCSSDPSTRRPDSARDRLIGITNSMSLKAQKKVTRSGLRGLAAHCEFSNLEEAILDKFVMGMKAGHERNKPFAQNIKELTKMFILFTSLATSIARLNGTGKCSARDGQAEDSWSAYEPERAGVPAPRTKGGRGRGRAAQYRNPIRFIPLGYPINSKYRRYPGVHYKYLMPMSGLIVELEVWYSNSALRQRFLDCLELLDCYEHTIIIDCQDLMTESESREELKSYHYNFITEQLTLLMF